MTAFNGRLSRMTLRAQRLEVTARPELDGVALVPVDVVYLRGWDWPRLSRHAVTAEWIGGEYPLSQLAPSARLIPVSPRFVAYLSCL